MMDCVILIFPRIVWLIPDIVRTTYIQSMPQL